MVIVLQHNVFRSSRDPQQQPVTCRSLDRAHELADVLASLTSASPWQQELVELPAGRVWVRTSDSATCWALAHEPPAAPD